MKRSLAALFLLAVLSWTPSYATTQHDSKTVIDLFLDNNRPCAFFQLVGVSQADPSLPGSPWFSLPKSHPSFAELFSILATARAGNLPVKVLTTNNLACGHPEVNEIKL